MIKSADCRKRSVTSLLGAAAACAYLLAVTPGQTARPGQDVAVGKTAKAYRESIPGTLVTFEIRNSRKAGGGCRTVRSWAFRLVTDQQLPKMPGARVSPAS
jgi:hypothetical protein